MAELLGGGVGVDAFRDEGRHLRTLLRPDASPAATDTRHSVFRLGEDADLRRALTATEEHPFGLDAHDLLRRTASASLLEASDR